MAKVGLSPDADDKDLADWMAHFADPPRRKMADMYNKWSKIGCSDSTAHCIRTNHPHIAFGKS
eukprot:CAMPEP_0206266894 /NCGR_PEP_ID=MMETSP0047_2-20121206/30844_1 /ASSEMBLY_ACC=CAM_ASM_000192 /TAXON_ID=195065 /ORGANISM="Chroomonas mesostigmatica_cf, Strain CCMP1168" /LENGTH=62 /DNA_ID=CAMNT_0053695031 /DNA_START=63 /DNA_END=248 /DNA_ORIENTATION=-